MIRHWLIAVGCLVTVICLFQDVTGESTANQCVIQCRKRCRDARNKQNNGYWSCIKDCALLSKLCVNCRGPHRCQRCAPGYRLSYSRKCVDRNECLENNGGCSMYASCTNLIGQRRLCTCNPGFSGSGKMCTDDDECSTSAASCSTFANCENIPGNFTCTCRLGYSGDGFSCKDVDECATQNGGCPNDANCVNSNGSFKCICKPGYAGPICEDINECLTSNGGCSPYANCENNPGTRKCTCKDGFEGDGFICTDIDECIVQPNGRCSTDADCANTFGSRLCTCKTGFTGDGENCIDIPDCLTNNGGCSPYADCLDMPAGSRTCTCKAGYTGDGISCKDIDECASGTANCDPKAYCSNNAGSFTCTCNIGWTGSGLSCQDIDECSRAFPPACPTQLTCFDNDGSYTCGCNTGYQRTGLTCTDIDECKVGTHQCDPLATCTDTEGSYTCQCKSGYEGNGFMGFCADRNECDLPPATYPCSQFASCQNSPAGSYTCTCNPGFTGDGKTCTALCDIKNGGCSEAAICTDTSSTSPVCTCKTGYIDQSVSPATGIICTGESLTAEFGPASQYIDPSRSYALWHEGSATRLDSFVFVPCLAKQMMPPPAIVTNNPDSCVSMQWEFQTQYYLRHTGFIMYANIPPTPIDDTFLQDASFIMRTGVWIAGKISLESVNYPGRFVRSIFSGNADVAVFVDNNEFKQRASFTKTPRS